VTGTGTSSRRAPAIVAVALLLSLSLAVAPDARAGDDARVHQGHFLRLAAGFGYVHESWHASGGTADAVHRGWGPALEIAVGKHVRPGLVLGGSLQLTGIINRDETTRGVTFPLDDTVHFVDTVAALVDYYPNPRRGLHAGGTLGVAAITELDTHMGGTQTSLGPAASLHAGYERFVSKRWSAGGLARLAFHRYGTERPPPAATSNGLLASLLLAFTFD
jgi:hypothetical protein